MAVYRALAFYDRQVIFILKTDHVHLIYIHKRTDHSQIHAVQISPGREGMEPSFKYQGEEHGLDDIILVMRVCHLITSHFLDRLVQGAFAHFGAERAGIAFLTYIEKNVIDIRPDDLIRNFHLTAEILDRRKIKILKSEIHCNSAQLKFLRIEPLKSMESVKESKAVLPSGDPDRDMVPILDHIVFINCLAGITQQTL